MSDPDAERVKRAQNGDPEAFAELAEAHYDRIYRMTYRLSGYVQDAEDLAQEICVKLATRLESFRGDSRFSTWLYQLILNGYRDWVKKQSARRRLEQAYAALESLEGAERPGEVLWLYRRIAGLEASLRETALLVLTEDLSHAEAARILDCAESTVSWRMSEVRKHLTEPKS